MKSVLVAYSIHTFITDSGIVKVKNDYNRVKDAEDDFIYLKKCIVKQLRPRRVHISTAPDSCGGYINISELDSATHKNISIIAITDL